MKLEYDFDKAFSSFIDGNKYEKTEDMLFSLVLAAFTAGWNAAGGEKTPKADLISKYTAAERYLRMPSRLRSGE